MLIAEFMNLGADVSRRVRPSERLLGDFLAFCIRAYFDEGILKRLFTCVGIPRLTGAALAKLTFPVSPP